MKTLHDLNIFMLFSKIVFLMSSAFLGIKQAI